MKRSVIPAALATLMLVIGATAMPASAQPGGDVLVSVGSPTGPFSANKQNEPAVAIDQAHPNVLAAGSNDNIDMEACNAGHRQHLPVHRGRRRLGHLLLVRLGHDLDPADVHGLSAEDCTGAVGDADPPCAPHVGPIGTLPELLRERPRLRRRPRCRLRPGARTRRLLAGRTARACTTPTSPRPSLASAVQRVRGDRRVAHGRRRRRRRRRRARDGATRSSPRSRTRPCSPTRSRSGPTTRRRARSSATCTSATRASVACPAFASRCSSSTSTDGGDNWTRSRSRRRPTTPQPERLRAIRLHDPHRLHGVVYVFDDQFASTPGFRHRPDPDDQVPRRRRDVDPSQEPASPSCDGCAYSSRRSARCVEDGVGGARDDLMPDPSRRYRQRRARPAPTPRTTSSW